MKVYRDIRIGVPKLEKESNITHRVSDPIRYPKVQCGYEGLAQVIFSTQVNNMMDDLAKEMLNISKQ